MHCSCHEIKLQVCSPGIAVVGIPSEAVIMELLAKNLTTAGYWRRHVFDVSAP